MEDGQVTVANPAQDVATQTQTATDTQAQGAQTVDYEKRFTDTQAAYTRSQQELSDTRKSVTGLEEKLNQILPYYEQQKNYFSPEKTSNSAWDHQEGIDGAFHERDQKIGSVEEKLNQVLQNQQSIQVTQIQGQFREDQNRLYQEIGQKEFGSADDFAHIMQSLPGYDPNWELNYMKKPSYDTLKQSYYQMAGAARYDTNSAFSRLSEAKRQQDFLRKQSNYLGSGQSIKYGPSETNPNSAYMSPIESV